MKVAFLTPEYPHFKTGNSGGIGTSIKNLAESLVILGHEVRILVYGQSNDEVFENENITIQLIKNVKFKGLSRILTQNKIQNIIDKLYFEHKIDIVEAPDWTGITSFIKTKECPIVIRLNGSDTYFCHLDKRPVKFFNFFNERRALKNADGHISVSKFTADKTNELFGLKIPFTIIPNGINANIFIEDNTISKEPNSILYFGTLIRKKGLFEIPIIFNNVIESVPEAKLTLVGRDAFDIQTKSSSTWELMKPLFSENALKQVEYLGGVPYTEVKKFISKSSVCIFPTFAEALPVSWLEAMAMKKAIVASNIGWAPEVIENNIEGYLANPKDHLKFSDCIIKLLKDPYLNINFGKNATIKVFDKFDNKHIANQSLNFYKKYCKR